MEREREEPLDVVLREAGFTVSGRCRSRPSCFDFAARKNEALVLVKFHSDIDNLSECDSSELRTISECVSAGSLLVGEKTRERLLENDTVYSRYEVLAVTPKTFENIILRKTHPLIHAGPGGYYVEIDGEAIKKRRQELGLSVGQMAEMIGISRRTLYGYERGMAKASAIVAYNIIYTLGVPVAKPIDIFEKSRDSRKCFLASAKFTLAKNRLLQKILRKFTRYRITTVKKAPFDFVMSIPQERISIIGAVADGKERELEKRVGEILSFSRVVKAHPILITEERKSSTRDIMCICKEELSRIKDPRDLISRV